MTRKRRVFDIDLPADPAPEPKAKAPHRRGPMASAIAENAEALQARKAASEAIREENDALAHEFIALRKAGHVVEHVLLDDVHTRLLLRDRIPGEDAELAELVSSIRDLGLSNPIRVVPRTDGTGYELVQGFRRLGAYRQLAAEGQGDWSRVPALILHGASDVPDLYRRMVDENVIRKDLSFAEMAQAAQNYAADPATEATDVSAAIAALFQSAPYSKRSYIKSFAYLLDRIGRHLMYPTELPRALGVSLAREMKERPEIEKEIARALDEWDTRSIQDELDVLRGMLSGAEDIAAVPKPARKSKTRTKTTFHISSRAGQVKCTAGPGRLEIKVDRDFSTIERRKLERAIASLIDGLA